MDHDQDQDAAAQDDSAGRPLAEPPGPAPRHDFADVPPPAPYRRKVALPMLLYLATIASTFWAGGEPYFDQNWRLAHFSVRDGLLYCVALMSILTAHELGHFFQAVRYGVPASWPFFIPMPFPPVGTMGAVIAMRAQSGDRKAMFDIGITGPIAGLVVTLVCCFVGLQWSYVPTQLPPGVTYYVTSPLLFDWIRQVAEDPALRGRAVSFHPIASAGWVGLLITSLNLMPIGQLDGGHILYALLRKHARWVATTALAGAVLAVVFVNPAWAPFVILLCLMGPRHPPTADDSVPLGWPRIILGWLMLAFVLIGFTPVPFVLP